MNAEFALRLLKLVVDQKHSVLLLAPVPIEFEPIIVRTTVVTTDNAFEVAEWVLSGVGGFFADPNGLLDPAVVDKMIVVNDRRLVRLWRASGKMVS